jgi:hypothetical protein
MPRRMPNRARPSRDVSALPVGWRRGPPAPLRARVRANIKTCHSLPVGTRLLQSATDARVGPTSANLLAVLLSRKSIREPFTGRAATSVLG